MRHVGFVCLLLHLACLASGGCASGPDHPNGIVDAGNLVADGGRGNGDVELDSSMPIPCAQTPSSADSDGDGFSVDEGDCNDCDPTVNPGAFDFPSNLVDDDCDGDIDPVLSACDTDLAMASPDPEDAARSLGLCVFPKNPSRSWGVLNGKYTAANGKGTLSNRHMRGILPSFGVVTPTAGKSMLALSSGVARALGQADFTGDCDLFDQSCVESGGCDASPPRGYPRESSACREAQNKPVFTDGAKIYDQAALELEIRVPSNANSLSFDSIFYTYEYPRFICNEYNDFFVALLEPKPEGSPDGNIVYDKRGDPIGVNAGLLAVCDPSSQPIQAPIKFQCEQGTALLAGTGFAAGEFGCGGPNPGEGGASTGWLHTTAPVTPGTVITLRFAVWDTNDADLDSTVLIDNFAWSPDRSDMSTDPIIIF